MKALRVSKKCPTSFEPRRYGWGARCISFTFSSEGSPSTWQCGNSGTILTDRGVICAQHARAWARRGWLNIDKVREILSQRAQNEAKARATRASCLRRGQCI